MMGPSAKRLPDREEIRRRLAGACPEVVGGADEGIPAAVLIGLLAKPGDPDIVLTQRTANLRDHAAEISLPGGRVESGDDGPAMAALRETFEEIGVPPADVELLGCLPTYRTVTGYRVYPFVGWIEPPVEFRRDEREVADIFQVPLRFVLDPANHQRDSLIRDGTCHSFYVLPYPGRRIWGATAAILVSLARLLAP